MAAPETWRSAHARESRSYWVSAAGFVLAVARFPWPTRTRRRLHPRTRCFRPVRLRRDGGEDRALLSNRSPLGLGLLCGGSCPEVGGRWRIAGVDGAPREGRVVHAERALPFVWRVGVEFVVEAASSTCEVELAA
jgi:hypothetical protein